MSSKKVFFALGLLVIMTFIITGCAGATPTTAPQPTQALQATQVPQATQAPAGKTGKLTIALSLPDMAFPFFVNMAKQFQDEAGKLGNVDIVLLDGTNKVPKQTADMEAVIAKKYDGVVISPIDAEAMKPGVQEVIDANIPVVTVDRNVNGVNTLAHVGADNVRGGELEGELLVKLFPNGAKVVELEGQPGASPAIDRHKGLHNVIDKQDKVKIVFDQTANFRRDQGLSVTEAALAANPNPDAIVAANDDMALGATQSVEGKGLKGKTLVIGYDALPEALKAIQDGAMSGTVDQFPGKQARTALDLIVDFIRNGKKPAQHDNFLPPTMITKDNFSQAERIGEIASLPAATAAPAAGAYDGGQPTNPPDRKGKPLTIFDVPKLIGIDYFNATAKGMQDAAKELGNVTVTTDAPTEAKIEKQIEFIDNDITKNPDVIMYASNDPVAIAPVLKKALSKGILVVGYDADAQPDARMWFVNQASFEGIGNTLVDVMAKEAGEDAQCAIVTSSLTAPNQNEWIKWMKKRMADKYPNMKLLDTRPSEEDTALAFKVTQDLIKTYPNMNCVWGISSVAFPGAADAIKQAGKSGKVHVTGLSTPKNMKKFVKDGTVQTVVLWNPVDLGYCAVYAARAVADGTLKPGDTELKCGKVGTLKITGSEILLGLPFQFNKDNIDNFDF